MKKITGISLLEMLLVTVVIAAACLVSVRLYLHSKEKQTVLQAELQVSRLIDASHTWLFANREADFKAWTQDMMSELIAAGLLEDSDKTNPWGGAVTVTGSTGGLLEVEFSGVAAAGCAQLASRFAAMAATSCKEGVWIATF